MCELYKKLCREIKDNMDEFIETVIEYNDYDGEEWEEFF